MLWSSPQAWLPSPGRELSPLVPSRMTSHFRIPTTEEALQLLEGLIPPGEESVAAVKDFSEAADYLFQDKAFFYAR